MPDSTNIYEQTVANYCEYAKYVNAFRSIPSIYDGMKPVHRRVLYCAYRDVGCTKRFVKSATVTGATVGRYHPHGTSSVYGALVGLVNSPYGVFEGHGNFGALGIDCAAERYTEVKVSKVAKDVFLEYLDEVPYFLNDLGNQEPVYLPTLIPMVLTSSTFGIGVGTSTSIPAFTLESLLDYTKYLANGKNGPVPEIKINYPNYKMEDTLLTEGHGSVLYNPEINWSRDDDGREVLVITRVAPNLDPSEVLISRFSEEISQGLVFVRNESSKKIRVVIGRCHNVRKITDNEIEEKVRLVLTRKYSYNMNWATDKGIEKHGVYRVLQLAYENYGNLFKSDLEKKLERLRSEMRLYTHAEKFVELMMKNTHKDEIISQLNITKDDYDSWSRKSILTLQSYKNNEGIRKVKSDIKTLSIRKVSDAVSEVIARIKGEKIESLEWIDSDVSGTSVGE